MGAVETEARFDPLSLIRIYVRLYEMLIGDEPLRKTDIQLTQGLMLTRFF